MEIVKGSIISQWLLNHGWPFHDNGVMVEVVPPENWALHIGLSGDEILECGENGEVVNTITHDDYLRFVNGSTIPVESELVKEAFSRNQVIAAALTRDEWRGYCLGCMTDAMCDDSPGEVDEWRAIYEEYKYLCREQLA